MRTDPHQELVMDPFEMFLPPAQYPTWHERAFFPGTPEAMHMLLEDEHGARGEFGHTFWGEHHPAFTSWMTGYVWLPGIKMHEVPGYIRPDTVLDYRDGRVFLKAAVDPSMGAPEWTTA
jgi:hypothetical protein